jgi:hypothetical protein
VTFADLLAHGISIAFIVAGLFALGAGDMGVGRTRLFRMPVDIVGSDRTTFGLMLLGMGYGFQRWLLRTPGRPLRWALEAQVLGIFVAAGYVAYRMGTAA